MLPSICRLWLEASFCTLIEHMFFKTLQFCPCGKAVLTYYKMYSTNLKSQFSIVIIKAISLSVLEISLIIITLLFPQGYGPKFVS